VNLIDEEYVLAVQVGQDSRQVARAFDSRAGRGLDTGTDLCGYDVGKTRLTEAGRAVE